MGRDGVPVSGPAPRHVGTNGESVAHITIDSPDPLYYYYNEHPTTVAGWNIEPKDSHMKTYNSYNDTLDRVGLNRLILQNNITQVDPNIWDDPQLWNTDDNGDSEPVEVYQWYATDISTQHQADICKLHGLIIVYSDIMDTYYLAVDHYGTAWDYVPHHDPMNA